MISPCYITLAGTKKGEGALITRGRDKAEHIVTLNNFSPKDINVTYFGKDVKAIIQTNADWWKIPNLPPGENILDSKQRCNKAVELFKKLKPDEINETSIANTIFMKYPIVNDLTIYITAMVPSKSHLSTRLTIG